MSQSFISRPKQAHYAIQAVKTPNVLLVQDQTGRLLSHNRSMKMPERIAKHGFYSAEAFVFLIDT